MAGEEISRWHKAVAAKTMLGLIFINLISGTLTNY